MACCTRKLYRSNNRVIFGVCQGIAEHFDLPVVWVRLGVILLATLVFPFVIVAYFVLALVLKPRPEVSPEDMYQDEVFYDTHLDSRVLSLRRMKAKFDSIEHRIRRMENYVTNKSYDWERRFKAGE